MIQLTRASVSMPSGNALARLKAAFLPSKDSSGEKKLLDDFTLWIGHGESWAILGEEDAGKTTLLKLIAGRVMPSSGICKVEGQIAAAIYGDDGFFKHETGEGNTKLAAASMYMTHAKTEKFAQKVDRLFADEKLFLQPVAEYDEQARARLSVAIALSCKPDVLILASQLERCGAPFVQQSLFSIRRMQRDGMTLLLECGDVALLSRLCENAVLIEKGKLVKLGPLESVYAAFAAGESAPNDAKNWLATQRAAFSAPLAPAMHQNNSTPQAPGQTDQAMLDALAETNMADEEALLRLHALARECGMRVLHAEATLKNSISEFSDTIARAREEFERINAILREKTKRENPDDPR